MVEKARRPAEDAVRPDLVRENSDLKTLNRKLEQEVNLLKANLEIMQAEVYKQRFAGFEQVDAPGMHSQAVKFVSNQLEELKRFGLVSESLQGWRWL
jgi:hypothetical protein